VVLRPGDRREITVDFGGFRSTAIGWNPAEDKLAVGGRDGSLRFVTDHGTTVSHSVAGGKAPITFLQWSTHDRLLTKDSAGVIRVYDRKGSKVGELSGQQRCGDPVPSPPGDAFVVSCGASSLAFYDANANHTGSYSSADDLSSPVWAPSGAMVAVGDAQGRLQIIAPDGALLSTTSAFPAASAADLPSLFWAPTGDVLLGGNAANGSLRYAWSESDGCKVLLRYFDSSTMNAMLGSNSDVAHCKPGAAFAHLPPIPVMQRRPDA
jgi:WD40 repeat protein